MERTVLESPAFAEGWAGRPVFVAQGGKDHNVKPATVTAAVERLRTGGVAVTLHLDPGADHFLFFADRAGLFERIAAWDGFPGTAAGASGPRFPPPGSSGSSPRSS